MRPKDKGAPKQRPTMKPMSAATKKATAASKAYSKPSGVSEAGVGWYTAGKALTAAAKAVIAANKKAGVSSVTKRTSGFQSGPNPAIKSSVTKRRIGTQGQAAGSVKAKANKEIKAERKKSGESLYEKEFYGRKSVNARKPASVLSKGQKAAGARYAKQAKKK